MEGTPPIEEGEGNKDTEVAPALIAVHPAQDSISVAVGSDLRVFDLKAGYAVSLLDDSAEPFHKDSIRSIRYGAWGKLFVSAGDDKIVKIWSTKFWRCLCTVYSEKRVSAVVVSNDGMHVCFADKFGVVWVVDLDGIDSHVSSVNKKAAPLLSHYCSIITSLEFSPDGRFIVSADRDFKIRVTIFPEKPAAGAHEIQSFCLGHTEFVSCLSIVCPQECPQGLLVSGSGDSTVRLWNISSGSLLDTCDVGMKAESLEANGATEDHKNAITDLCTIHNGTVIAAAIQSLQGIVLLSCDLSANALSVLKVVSVAGEVFIPTSLGSSLSAGLLWMVTGVSNLPGFDSPPLARVKVASIFDTEQEPTILDNDKVPGGKNLLDKLQGNAYADEKAFLAATEAVKIAMCSLLVKKQYSAEKREFRKRTRNDKKTNP